MRLEHVAIDVAKPIEMAAWYVENLGLSIVRSESVSPFAHFLVDSDGVSVVEIYNNPATTVPDYTSIHPLQLHFAFNVDDIEKEHARLVAAGATAFGPINTTPAGDQLAFLRDPWQVTIQLVKRQKPLLGS
jgi:glyoxylase I family protein